MKKYFVQLSLSILLLSVSGHILLCQERYDKRGLVRSQLMNLIHERYGSDFKNVGYTILDSLIAHSLRENNRIRDPYGTLRGCILFSTYKEYGESVPDTFIVGIVKNGQIIWDNAPGTSADLEGNLLYAQDINNDGEVDLLISENDWELSLMRGPFLYYLYVLSWNGTRGIFINKFGNDGKSSLMGDGGFKLVDKNKNGIWNITTSLPDVDRIWGDYKTGTFPCITYNWNGKQFGFWPDVKPVDKKIKNKK